MAEPVDPGPIDTVVFDIGGVLLDWNPEHLYRRMFEDEAQMRWFLANVCTPAWNAEQDRGRPFALAVALAAEQHPDWRPFIEAYRSRWIEMVSGPVPGSVELLAEVRQTDVRLLGLSNWSAETFPLMRERYPFLSWFEGIVVSGEEAVAKPDPEIYQLLVARYGVEPQTALFIDDSLRNVEAASALGFQVHRFTSADGLRQALAALGVA
jgi:2-haloacid dehalogenase